MQASILTRKIKIALSVFAFSYSVFALHAEAANTVSTGGDSLGFTNGYYISALNFDYSGENGVSPSNANSVGFPCGVPNSYNWKFAMQATPNVAAAIAGRGTELAAAAWLQVYNDCSGLNTRKQMPNARIELSRIYAYYFSISGQQWIKITEQPIGGAAYAEDFVNNQNVAADIRSESQDGSGYFSVRSGIGNASGDAGSSTGRTVEDGPVGYNFHGYANRFNLNWADAQAVVVIQAMRCIPNFGTDLTDCQKLGYIADVGLDSWATTTSAFDGFKTHGGVGGGRFKPLTTDWQIFTSFSGPQSMINDNPPPLPAIPLTGISHNQ